MAEVKKEFMTDDVCMERIKQCTLKKVVYLLQNHKKKLDQAFKKEGKGI